jgi:beta-glucosidase/6-phospho-beta-glucosidase/beta-galactosidase
MATWRRSVSRPTSSASTTTHANGLAGRPQGLYDLLTGLSKEAPGLPLYIIENGRVAEDYVNPEGQVNDVERIRYLPLHLVAVARANAVPALPTGRISPGTPA